MPWRRFSLNKDDQKEAESEEEILEEIISNVKSMELEVDDFEEQLNIYFLKYH